jgi:hypothetical protein
MGLFEPQPIALIYKPQPIALNRNVLQTSVIWNLCHVENNKMAYVKRILQFSNIPSEPPLVIENCRPKETWPWSGTIHIEALKIEYSPGIPMVLKRRSDLRRRLESGATCGTRDTA